MGAVIALKGYLLADTPIRDGASRVTRSFQCDYPEDLDIRYEMADAARQVFAALRMRFTDDEIGSMMSQLQYCILNYHPTGGRKWLKYLGGSLFARSESAINPDRTRDSIRNLTLYYEGSKAGAFPAAPEGWSLSGKSAKKKRAGGGPRKFLRR